MLAQRNPNINANLIAKVHIAKTQLALDDTSYRCLLKRIAGKESCSLMSGSELGKVLDEFKRLGFKPAKKRAGLRKLAQSPHASKIRALWLSLYHLGEINDSSEEALAAFAQRTARVSALQWLTADKADTIIRSLKGWLDRVGFKEPSAEQVRLVAKARVRAGLDADLVEAPFAAIVTKVYLVHHQMKILKTEASSSLDSALYIPFEDLDRTIELAGKEIRARKDCV